MSGLRWLAAACALAAAGCAVAPEVSQEERWQAHTRAGQAAAQQGRLEEAEREFLAAVAAITTVRGNEGRVLASLNHLAALYLSAKRPEAAEPVLTKAADFAEKTVGVADPDAAMILQNLAALQASMKKFAEAETTLRKMGTDDAPVQEQLAAVLLEQGKVAEAGTAFLGAAAAWEKKLGPAHPDLAARLDGMAGACATRGALEPAAALLARAIESSEKAFGPRHPNVAASAQNLAGVRAEQGRWEEAERLYRRALAIWEEAFGREHAVVGGCLQQLGRVYERLGREEDARKARERAREIAEKTGR